MVAILAKVLFMEAPSLTPHRSDAPPALVKLVARMLEKEPAARPQDGKALLAELEALAARGALATAASPLTPVPHALTQAEQRLVSVTHRLRDPADPRGDDRPPERHRLEQGERKPLRS